MSNEHKVGNRGKHLPRAAQLARAAGGVPVNVIRKRFGKEIQALMPLLHDTYRAIGRYQRSRHRRNAEKVEQLFAAAGAELLFFKTFLQTKKQPYFDAILDESLSLSDRIIALDTVIGFMHIEFSVARAYSHQESTKLREALEMSRQIPGDRRKAARAHRPEALLTGVPASPGVATGPAVLIRTPGHYERVPAKSVVVTRMTRPDLIVAAKGIAAIVTDAGGSLCHAAIIAREWGIPCVVGTRRATPTVSQGWILEVDGTQGTVTRL